METSVIRVRHRWAEKSNFVLDRPKGTSDYVLLHFLTPVTMVLDGKKRHVEKGSLIVFSPGASQHFEAHEPLLHDWMNITGDVKELMGQYRLRPDVLYHPNQPTAISDIVCFMEMEFFAQHTYWPQLQRVKLEELFIRVAHALEPTTAVRTIGPETEEHLRTLRSRMLSEPWQDWTVPVLANHVHISESRLHALYKSLFGISPRRDLVLMRIEKAKTMLQSGTSVSDTAEQLGYGNVYHFIRQFRTETGITPKQFAIHAGEYDSKINQS